MSATNDDLLAELKAIRTMLEIMTGANTEPSDNPTVAFIPKNLAKWASLKGRKFSQCPPEFLRTFAGFLKWLSENEEKEGKEFRGKPQAPFTLAKAKTAKAWSVYLTAHPEKAGAAGASEAAAPRTGGNPFAKKEQAPAPPEDDGEEFYDDSEPPF